MKKPSSAKQKKPAAPARVQTPDDTYGQKAVPFKSGQPRAFQPVFSFGNRKGTV